MRIFEVLFKGVIPRFGRRTIEKSIENPHFICERRTRLRIRRPSARRCCSTAAARRLRGARRAVRLKAVLVSRRQLVPNFGRISILGNCMLLKRRFSKTEKHSGPSLEHFFNGVSARFGLLLLEKVLKTTFRKTFRFSKIFVWGA